MIRPLDIRPDHLEIVKSILREHLSLEVQVWIFGSRADWLTKDSSDLDIALEGKRELSQELLGILKSSFEDSALPFSVDIVDLNRVGEPFRRVVESQRIPLPIGGNGVRRNVKMNGVSTKSDNNSHTSPSTLPPGWRELAFSDAVLVNPSVRLSRGDTYPFVDMASVNGDRKPAMATEQREFKGGGSRFQRGDTLMARITPCLENGKIAQYVPMDSVGEAHGSTEFVVIRGRPEVSDTDYSYYLTKWDGVRQYAISQMTGTSGRQRVPTEALNHLEIPLPPLEEQRAIAHVLGTLDDKIELNRRMNETLEAMARALFTSWFVDFEPVRAKMDGRWRRDKSLPCLPADLYDLFPDRLVPSQLGDIPEGWEVKALGEFAQVVYGAPFASAKFNEAGDGLPLIRIRDLATHNPTVFTDEQHPNGTLIKPGDIVVGMDGEFRAHIWKGTAAWLNQRVCHFRPHSGTPRSFLFEALIGPLSYFERAKVGTTVIHLGKTDIDSIMLLSPPSELLSPFDSFTEPMVDQIVANAAQNQGLAEQRDVLLPSLVSGEVRV